MYMRLVFSLSIFLRRTYIHTIYSCLFSCLFSPLSRQRSSLARPKGEGRGRSGGSRIRGAFFPIYGVKGLNARVAATFWANSFRRAAGKRELSLWSECNNHHEKELLPSAALVALPATDDGRTLLIISICIHDNLVPLRALSVKGASGTEGTRDRARSEILLAKTGRFVSVESGRLLLSLSRRDKVDDPRQLARALDRREL